MKKILSLVIALLMCITIIPCNTYAVDYNNDIDFEKRYDITELKVDDYGNYDVISLKFEIPNDGRVKFYINEYINEGYETYFYITRQDGKYSAQRAWNQNVESLNSGWISVNKGTFITKIRTAEARKYDGFIYAEFEPQNAYSGEVENNDSFELANSLSYGIEYYGNNSGEDSTSFTSFPIDDDYYAFNVKKHGKVSILTKTINTPKERLNYELYEEMDNGNVKQIPIETGSYYDYPSTVESFRLHPGKYYIKVILECEEYDSEEIAEYSLMVEYIEENAESFEQESNDVSRSANVINAGQKYTANLNNYDDIDWYVVNVPVKSTLMPQFWMPRQDATYLVYVSTYDSSLKVLSEGYTGTQPYMEIDPVTVQPGNYYIRVSNHGGLSNLNDYQIQAKVECVNHMLNTKIIKAADYGVVGQKKETCSICGYSKTINIPALQVKPVTNLKAKMLTNKSFKITWSKANGATAYNIYVKKGTGNYYKKARIANTEYTIKNLEQGKKYTFAVVPCYQKNGKYVEVSSSIKSVSATTLAKVMNVKVNKATSKKIKIKWKGIAGETGYQVARSATKNGKYSVIANTKLAGSNYPAATIKAKKNKIYYYKVRAYKQVGNKKIYGPWSSKKAYTLK